jgi:hypothetical protein
MNSDCYSGLDPESICPMDSRIRGNDTVGMASIMCKQIAALINKCCGTAGVSYDSVILPAGDHSLTIKVAQSPSGIGAAFFRIDGIVGVPEPLSVILLCFGLLGLGAIRRSRG